MKRGQELLEGVLEEFARLAAIPRPSGHEEAVSNFLKDYLTSLGFSVVQDEKFNIIADKEADEGFESAPLTILQGHMDMVCVAEEGYAYDPLHDPIKLVRSEKYLEAEGTSLGADDGIGVAEAIYIMKNCSGHGPLRLIVTVDEEQGMSGAAFLDKKYLEDAAYLINCDSENYDELTVGCAGNVTLDFCCDLSQVTASGLAAWKVEVKGLRGGHSGERIGDGRGNAIRTLAMILSALQEKGQVEIASINGGRARNVIPSDASAVIVTELSEDEIGIVLADQRERFLSIYGEADPGICLSLVPAPCPSAVFCREDSEQLLRLVRVLHTGVYAMSQTLPTLVETSANLGVIMTNGNQVEIQFLPRSSIDRKIDEFCIMAADAAALAGFSVHIGTPAPGWKENKQSRLAELMAEIFEQQNGKPMKVGTIHAGLECGWHYCKNPKLDIVSIGVTTQEIHSPRERLLLETVTPQVELIVETLHRIAKK